ncbi:hypothetical protein [Desulfosporosinus fructosivorans]
MRIKTINNNEVTLMDFPMDERMKALLDEVCKSLNMSIEDWFKNALEASKSDVLKHSPDNRKW